MADDELKDTGESLNATCYRERISEFLEMMGFFDVVKKDLPNDLGVGWTFSVEGGYNTSINIYINYICPEDADPVIRIGTKMPSDGIGDTNSLFKILLEQNFWMYDTKFGIDEDDGSVHLVAVRNPNDMDFSEFEEIVHSVVEYYNDSIDVFIRLSTNLGGLEILD